MSEMDRLRRIMERLRGPDGCPWDREQTLMSLRTFVVEETYEVVDAIGAGSPDALREELGDLMFQIVFQSRIAEEGGAFDIEAVMKGIGDKIVRRHPHVFGDGRLDTDDEVLVQWEQIKEVERRGRSDDSMFATVPAALPALLKALRVSAKAARVGFDWTDGASLWAKVEEELAELRQAVREGDGSSVREEIGDLLFTLVNVARHHDIDPELALQEANSKFIERFRAIERGLAAEGLKAEPRNRARMEELWEKAKAEIRKTSPDRTSPSAGTSGNEPRAERRGPSA